MILYHIKLLLNFRRRIVRCTENSISRHESLRQKENQKAEQEKWQKISLQVGQNHKKYGILVIYYIYICIFLLYIQCIYSYMYIYNSLAPKVNNRNSITSQEIATLVKEIQEDHWCSISVRNRKVSNYIKWQAIVITL